MYVNKNNEEFLFVCDQCGKKITKSNKNTKIINGKLMTLCGKHYAQYLKHNHFLDNNPRSETDANEFEITDDGVWVYTFNKKQEISGKFLIDKDDLDKVIVHKWRCWKDEYFTGNYRPISIHRFLLNPEPLMVVDHINGNRYDNRRSNLRIVTQDKNLLNKALLSNNKSGLASVWWDNIRQLWATEIHINYIKCYLGRYEKKEDAAFARYYAECRIFKEYRSTRNDDVLKTLADKSINKDKIQKYVDNRLKKIYHI